MFYVYLLRSHRDGQLYLGSTRDLIQRFREHEKGRVPSTRGRRPLSLIYYEAYRVESDVRRREHNLKLRANAWNQLRRRLPNTLKSD